MTSLSINASRRRAGMLIVALALVGGTGCITASIVHDVKQQNRVREAEEKRQKNIARLTPLADAGDPASATALVRELLAFRQPGRVDQVRVFALLSGAAARNFGPAQALLGEILVSGHFETGYPQVAVEPRFQDRERGLELLRLAAAQSCTYMRGPGSQYYYYNSIRPATQLSTQLGRSGHGDEARVWYARSVMHCADPSAQSLLWRITPNNASPQQRTEALALMLLTQDTERIAKAEAAMPAEEVSAARRDADQLRRKVAQSEQQYPAPGRKEMQ